MHAYRHTHRRAQKRQKEKRKNKSVEKYLLCVSKVCELLCFLKYTIRKVSRCVCAYICTYSGLYREWRWLRVHVCAGPEGQWSQAAGTEQHRWPPDRHGPHRGCREDPRADHGESQQMALVFCWTCRVCDPIWNCVSLGQIILVVFRCCCPMALHWRSQHKYGVFTVTLP